MLDKKEFIKFLIHSEVLTFGDFVTKSGRKTPYFINTGNFTTGKQLSALGKYYADNIMENMIKGHIPQDVNVLFGPAYKGIPLSVATAISLANNHGRNPEYCFNRKELKDHGEGGSLVGHKLQDGDKLLIIEDVITAGTAVKECIPILKNQADVQICGLVIAVDRMEKGQGETSAIQDIYDEYGIPTFPLVNIKEILDLLLAGGIGNDGVSLLHMVASLEEYMSKYCVR